MRRKNQADGPLSADQFMNELYRYRKGSVTRRHFLGVTGLGAWPTAVRAGAVPALRPRKAYAALAGNADRCRHVAQLPQLRPIFDQLHQEIRACRSSVTIFGSNEEMLAKLQAGSAPAGMSSCPPTTPFRPARQARPHRPARSGEMLPNYDPSAHDPRFTRRLAPSTAVVYAVPKDWGTTGYIVNTNNGELRADQLEGVLGHDPEPSCSGRVTVHDYQLTTIGNALKYFGYSFNSVDPKELAEAEKLLLAAKPHLFAHHLRLSAGDAQWRCRGMAMCWTGDATQLSP